MESYILKAINHMRYVSKKKHCPVKIFNYMQNNGASQYTYDSVEKKIRELIANKIIDDHFRIIDPVKEVLNLPPNDDVSICSEITQTNEIDSQSPMNNSNVSTPLLNSFATPHINALEETVVNITKTPHSLDESDNESDTTYDCESHLKLLEDKLTGRIVALKDHLLHDIYDLRNEISSLKGYYEKENCNNSVLESENVFVLKEKIKYLELENSLLKSDNSVKQTVIDSILQHNSNLLSNTSCNNVNHEIVNNPKNIEKFPHENKKGNKYDDKNNDKFNKNGRSKTESSNHQQKLRHEVEHDDQSPKQEIVIIGDSIIKHVNGREVSRNNIVKVRSHPGATTEDLIDYVKPSVRKKPKMVILHTGTNDITNNINTMQKIRKVINTVRENDANEEIEIVISGVTHREDRDLEDEIKALNIKLENFCKGKGMRFINNSNIRSPSLNRSKLHLNKSGTALISKNFSNIINGY